MAKVLCLKKKKKKMFDERFWRLTLVSHQSVDFKNVGYYCSDRKIFTRLPDPGYTFLRPASYWSWNSGFPSRGGREAWGGIWGRGVKGSGLTCNPEVIFGLFFPLFHDSFLLCCHPDQKKKWKKIWPPLNSTVAIETAGVSPLWRAGCQCLTGLPRRVGSH